MCRNLTLRVMHFQENSAQMTGVDLNKVYSYNKWQRRKLVKSCCAALITGLATNTVFTVIFIYIFICVCVYLFPGGELETVP